MKVWRAVWLAQARTLPWYATGLAGCMLHDDKAHACTTRVVSSSFLAVSQLKRSCLASPSLCYRVSPHVDGVSCA